MLRKLSHLITLLGLNSIPAIGWFVGGWSAGTTLGLFWIENVIASLLVAARISLHARANPCRGHFKYLAREGTKRGPEGKYVNSFLPVSLIFSAAHGFFLAVILLLLTHNGKGGEVELNWGDLGRGAVGMAVFLVIGFLIDLPGLKNRPFSWSEAWGDRMLSRVIIVHLTLIFGMAAVAFTGVTRAFFGVFVFLKTMMDLSLIIPQWEPKEAPGWLCRMMDKVPSAHPGDTFATFWAKDRQKEINRRAANELPWEG